MPASEQPGRAPVPPPWPVGGGEMGTRIRALDWANTPLGPLAGWSQRLRAAVDICLAWPEPAAVLWGPRHIQLYNDAYARAFPPRHPAMLGRPAFEQVPGARALLGPALGAIYASGAPLTLAGQRVTVAGDVGPEGRTFDLTFSAIRDESGAVGGLLHRAVETTARVAAGQQRGEAEVAEHTREARLAFLLALGDRFQTLAAPRAIMAAAAEAAGRHLAVASTGIALVHAGGLLTELGANYGNGRLPGLMAPGQRVRLAAFGSGYVALLRAGQDLFFADDGEGDRLAGDGDPALRRALGRAGAALPLMRDDLLVAWFYAAHPAPRPWNEDERQLLRAVADRAWAAVERNQAPVERARAAVEQARETVSRTREAIERTRVERALRESEAQFREFAAASSDVVWIRDAATLRLHYLGPAFRAIYGADAREALGGDDLARWAALLHPEDRTGALANLERVRAGERVTHEFRVIRPADGAVRWIRDTVFPLADAAGRIARIGGIARDITEEHQALETLEELVRARTAELRALSRQLLDVRETEQRALSRELHDQVGQLLTGQRLALARVQPADAPSEAALAQVREISEALQGQVRALILDLRPPALDQFGLLPALRDHLGRYTAQTGVAVDLRQAGLDGRLSPEIETAAYRVVQEGLTNVARHAAIGRATVQVLADGGWLMVQVRDEGRGFDPDHNPPDATHAGLMGMRERLELLGGTLTVDSAPGEGTVVTAELPLHSTDDERGEPSR